MNMILELIKYGCFTGIGLFIGFEGMVAFVNLLCRGIEWLIKTTLETKRPDNDWSDD